MSVLTAPGVYIEEIPSGNRSIAGVATSVTAFVGGASRGTIDEPTRCESFASFERLFGGLHPASTMSQSVRHFFLNGGRQALIVRVVAADADPLTLRATAALQGEGLERFQIQISNVNTTPPRTFTLRVTGIEPDGALSETVFASGTIDLDGGTPDADLGAIQFTGAALVDAPDGFPPGLPPEGTWTSGPNPAGEQTADVGRGGRVASGILDSDLFLVAANPGRWGDRIVASASLENASGDEFHLTLSELDAAGNTVSQEVYYNVNATEDSSPRWLGRVLERRSRLARLGTTGIFSRPSDLSEVQLAGGADGVPPAAAEVTGSQANRTGMYALYKADLFNILCLPLPSWSVANPSVWVDAMTFVEEQRAFLVVDPPEEWVTGADAEMAATTFAVRSNNAALYFPRVIAADPLQEGRPAEFPPCGVVAGIMARTDGSRGVWKAAAGIDATARGVAQLAATLTDGEQGTLNQSGINAFRTFPVYGNVIWGARTLNGADVIASDWKYVPVRRLALFLEESLYRGSQWAVFEPNDEPLWGQLRLSIGSFLHGLFRQGAFAGTSPAEAYFVKCDRETTTQADIDLGIVNVIVGYAPLKPAEFVILKIQQLVSQGG